MRTAQRTMWISVTGAVLTLGVMLLWSVLGPRPEAEAGVVVYLVFLALLCCTAASGLIAAVKPGARAERVVAIVALAALIAMLWPW